MKLINNTNKRPILKKTGLKSRNSLGFTLVELIVVITILAILGTIAFTQLGGFSGNARDSSRVSDLANISQGLDLTYIRQGSYPTPDNAINITYSGGVLWYQGTIGDTVMNILSSNGAKLSRKPTDPLTPTQEYTYSKTANSAYSYQLKTDYEGDSVAYIHPVLRPPLGRGIFSFLMGNETTNHSPLEGLGVDIAHAASNNPTITYIKGTYNGVVAKTITGSTTYIIATPSITTSQTGTTGSNFEITTLPNKLLLSGQTNSGGIAFIGKLVFSSGALPSTDPERLTFATALANTYSGTIVVSNPNIQQFITALSPLNNTTLTTLGGYAVVNWLGGVFISSPPTQQIAPYSSEITYVNGNSFTYNGAIVTVTATGRGISNTSYYGCPSADVVIWSGAIVPQIWSLCNVGATIVFTGTQISNYDNPIANGTTGGKYFQGGEDVAWDYNGGTGSVNNCTWNRDTQSCGSSALSGWISIVSDTGGSTLDLWYDWGGYTTPDTRGPCAPGYHVPIKIEWSNAYAILGDRNTFGSILKIPLIGFRANADGSLMAQGYDGYYWSSSPYAGIYAYYLRYNNNIVWPTEISGRANGFPVRCIKN